MLQFHYAFGCVFYFKGGGFPGGDWMRRARAVDATRRDYTEDPDAKASAKASDAVADAVESVTSERAVSAT